MNVDPVASTDPPPEALATHNKGRFGWLWACLGSVLIGVTLPTLLTCWHTWPYRLDVVYQTRKEAEAPKVRLNNDEFVRQSGALFAVATVCCAPGAIILGLLLFALVSPLYEAGQKQPSFTQTVLLGMGLSFLNLPGYLVATFVPIIHMFLLFIVTGATCGLWVGWQAWRSVHPDAGWLPRFSLKTMLLLVVAWAVLLMIFAPRGE